MPKVETPDICREVILVVIQKHFAPWGNPVHILDVKMFTIFLNGRINYTLIHLHILYLKYIYTTLTAMVSPKESWKLELTLK